MEKLRLKVFFLVSDTRGEVTTLLEGLLGWRALAN